MGNCELSEGYYITLRDPCLPTNWISSSDIVEIAGVGEIFFDDFSFLNEQHKPIHVINPPRQPGFSGRRITRTRRFEDILVFEERTSPPTTEFRTITATEADLGPFINFSYDTGEFFEQLFVGTEGQQAICSVGGNPNVGSGIIDSGVRIILNLNIRNSSAGDGGDWEHELKADLFDVVNLYPFEALDAGAGEILPTPFAIRDSRFLSFNTLTNGVDIEMQQIPGTPTFCNNKISGAFLNADPKNEIIINESSIEKEIPTPVDLTEVVIYDRGISFDGADPDTCGMSGNYGMQLKEYWLLEPPTTDLLAAMDPNTPNNVLFDDITSMQKMVEATAGQTELIYGIIRISTGFINSFNWTSNSNVFGGIANETKVRMSHVFGIDMAESTNTIQFSKDKPLFAGNGGLNLVGF